jgi:hypothetical protein
MPRKDPHTRMSERMLGRRSKLAERIQDKNPVGFGKTSMTRSEFRNRLQTNQAFRDVMVERMGVDNVLSLVEEPDGRT